MTTLRTIVVAIVTWAVAIAVALLSNRYVTAPEGQLLGHSNHTWAILAWWAIFAVLPLLLILDAATIPEQDWWSAGSTKVGWIGIIALVPVVGPLLYASVVRRRVADRFRRSRGAATDHPIVH